MRKHDGRNLVVIWKALDYRLEVAMVGNLRRVIDELKGDMKFGKRGGGDRRRRVRLFHMVETSMGMSDGGLFQTLNL